MYIVSFTNNQISLHFLYSGNIGAEVFQVKKSSMSRRLAKANAKMKKRKVLVKDEPQPGVDNSNSGMNPTLLLCDMF